MAKTNLNALRRTLLGKEVKKMRREGRVPGVVYGPVVAGAVPVSVESREFAKFFQLHGHATLFDLHWEDGMESVFIREVQLDPVKRVAIHVDFFAPNLRMPVRAQVPVVLHNPVQTSEGILTEARTEIEVEALPASIPHQIDIDVSGLAHPGDAIRVRDVVLPEGVSAVTDGDEVLVQMEAVYQTPEMGLDEAAPEEAAAPEAEAEASGEAAETAEDAG
jgi:large subunit ribosomal protein L25